MCKQGIPPVIVNLAYLADSKRPNFAGVDPCIASLVQALNNAGIRTIACCCGHGKQFGSIALADGRELFIAPNFDAARAVDNLLVLKEE